MHQQFEQEIEEAEIKRLRSGGVRPDNISEYFETGELGKIQSRKIKNRERLVCEQCGETTFLVNINGNHALFEMGDGNPIIVKFTEMIGICQRCLKKKQKAFTWLLTRYHLDESIAEMTGELKLSEKVTKPKSKTPYAFLFPHDNLRDDYVEAMKEMKKQNILDPDKIVAFLKEWILGVRGRRGS